MSDRNTWVVHDMAHEHRYCINENHPAEFGPMSEEQAREMVASNPKGYWAQNLAGTDE